MEKRDLLIMEYLSKGFKVTEISEQMKKNHATILSESWIEKRLRTIRKKYNAKTLFQLAVILKDEKVI